MDLAGKGSEEAFINLLSAIQENPDPWISVHINMVLISEEMLEKESLSKATMQKIENASRQVAKTLYNSPLNRLEGKIFVFEDSDVLALFKKDDGKYLQELAKLRQDFANNGLDIILSIDEMKNKLKSLIILSEEKKKSAETFRIKRYALQIADKIFTENSSDFIDRDFIINLQQRRKIHTKGQILLIEDDVVARGMVAMGLRDKYTILHAKDASSGLISYMDNAPDMVFLDIHLPDHNGREVLEKIKWIDPKAFVVMLSGDSATENVLATRAKGAEGFVRKPFTKEKIITYVQKCPTLAAREES